MLITTQRTSTFFQRLIYLILIITFVQLTQVYADCRSDKDYYCSYLNCRDKFIRSDSEREMNSSIHRKDWYHFRSFATQDPIRKLYPMSQVYTIADDQSNTLWLVDPQGATHIFKQADAPKNQKIFVQALPGDPPRARLHPGWSNSVKEPKPAILKFDENNQLSISEDKTPPNKKDDRKTFSTVGNQIKKPKALLASQISGYIAEVSDQVASHKNEIHPDHLSYFINSLDYCKPLVADLKGLAQSEADPVLKEHLESEAKKLEGVIAAASEKLRSSSPTTGTPPNSNVGLDQKAQ